MTLTIRKLEEHIGAEVEGVDITSPIDAETFDTTSSARFANTRCLYSMNRISPTNSMSRSVKGLVRSK